MKNRIQTSIIGYGMSAQVFHAPIIKTSSKLHLHSFVERHGCYSQERYPDTKLYKSTDSMLKDPAVELVIITTPNTSHFPLAKLALEAGKHVVVEKPFTPYSQQADELIALSEQKDQLLSVFQNRRWDGDFLTVRNLVKSGKMGRLVDFESHFDRFRNKQKKGAWREKDLPGSGILYDLGSHLIDQAQILFGLPELITADIRRQRNFSDVDDFFDVKLHYKALNIVLKASMLVKEDSPRFILHGTQGSFVKYGLDPQEKALKTSGQPFDEAWGREPKERWGMLYLDYNDRTEKKRIETVPGCYQNFYGNIANSLNDGAELIVKPEQARNTIRIIEKALLSSKEGRSIKYLT